MLKSYNEGRAGSSYLHESLLKLVTACTSLFSEIQGKLLCQPDKHEIGKQAGQTNLSSNRPRFPLRRRPGGSGGTWLTTSCCRCACSWALLLSQGGRIYWQANHWLCAWFSATKCVDSCGRTTCDALWRAGRLW